MNRESTTPTISEKAEPRNIVICCDGTGNEFGDQNSNVVKLYSSLIVDDTQIGYYHPGVGTMGSPSARNRIEREWSRLKGLAFGAGLMTNVSDAYRYLTNSYRPEDRIFLFGFSRGAYTVRALAGLLEVCGLLSPGNEGLIPYAVRLFACKSRAGKPKGPIDVAKRFKAGFSRNVLIDFVGVWDTVSSVGWIYDPVVLPDEVRNPIIKVGRHAISIDERRCFYRDKLWGHPFQAKEPDCIVPQDIRQVWFAGVHSDVGGSYPERQSGLSKIALEWMLCEAGDFGLKIDFDRAREVLGESQALAAGAEFAPPDPAATLHISLRGFWLPLEFLPHTYYNKPDGQREWRIPLGAHRRIPAGSLLHESVLERMNLRADYRPENLPDQYRVEPRAAFAQSSSNAAA